MIRVEPRGSRDFDVEVAEETTHGTSGLSFTYQVTVDDTTLKELGLEPTDEAALTALVRESFGYLLAREPAGSILRRFELSMISRYFPGYMAEIRPRVAR